MRMCEHHSCCSGTIITSGQQAAAKEGGINSEWDSPRWKSLPLLCAINWQIWRYMGEQTTLTQEDRKLEEEEEEEEMVLFQVTLTFAPIKPFTIRLPKRGDGLSAWTGLMTSAGTWSANVGVKYSRLPPFTSAAAAALLQLSSFLAHQFFLFLLYLSVAGLQRKV